MSKLEFYVYGYNSDPHSLGAGEMFVCTVTAKDKADLQRRYRNYQRQIARNSTRKRTPKQTITHVEK